jgi:peptide deformylase
MYAAPGIGLAATQVDVHKRIVVIESRKRATTSRLRQSGDPASDGEAECEEGCLSVPGYYDRVRRAARVKVRAQDAQGQPFELEAEGMLAVCIQHETEHLEGKIFVDHLSALKRQRLAARLRKRQRLAG